MKFYEVCVLVADGKWWAQGTGYWPCPTEMKSEAVDVLFEAIPRAFRVSYEEQMVRLGNPGEPRVMAVSAEVIDPADPGDNARLSRLDRNPWGSPFRVHWVRVDGPGPDAEDNPYAA